MIHLDGARVLVLGWAGSTARQLRPLARYYTERGGVPVTARAQVFEAMRRPDGWAREGESAVSALREAGDGPIYVHLFSNAGFWMYAAALERLRDDERDRIRAVALDSAPGFPPRVRPRFYAEKAAMAMMPMVLRSLGRAPEVTHPLLTPPLELFMRGWYHVSPEARDAAERSLRTVREVGDWPLLFLYSTADVLVRARHVEAFRATLGQRPTRSVRWTDSGHIKHMLTHREAYFDALEAFFADPPPPRPRLANPSPNPSPAG